jgi:hypothetical protein
MREIRLGDVIDDWCIKCKQVMNHSVVSMMETRPAKVRCRTCHSDHDFRDEQPPPPKIDPKKAALLAEAAAEPEPILLDERVEPAPKKAKAAGAKKKG